MGRVILKFRTGKRNPVKRSGEILPGYIFIWSGLTQVTGSYQIKIGNFLRIGIRPIRLTNGKLNGVDVLKMFKETQTLFADEHSKINNETYKR
jgi:hypothetical protein